MLVAFVEHLSLRVQWCIHRWIEVGEEVQEAARAGMLGLTDQEVHAQLCFALLRSARFNLAKTYLTGVSPLDSNVQVVWVCPTQMRG